jgi:hypothetical protein
MKRTAATLALLAGFGSGCASTNNNAAMKKVDPTGGFGTVTTGKPIPGVVGPNGEPVMATARGAMPGGVIQAGGTMSGGTMAASSGIQQAGLLKAAGDCPNCYVPGTGNAPLWNSPFASKGVAAGPPPAAGGPAFQFQRGILPVPSMGPPGAVAAVGAIVPGMGGPGAVAVGRTSVKFTGPAGMKVTWQMPGGGFNDESTGLTAPKEYNFLQGQTYRLRLTQILPNFPGRAFYPTLELPAANPKSLTYLAHSSVPLTFTNEDFEQARAGNLVVKVIYLPDRENQDFATVGGAEVLVSTRLEPGADPVAEAQRRGTVLAIIRLGNIDLENRSSPGMTAPPGAAPPGSGPIILPGPASTTPGPLMPIRPGLVPPLVPAPAPGPVPAPVPAPAPPPGAVPAPVPPMNLPPLGGAGVGNGAAAKPPVVKTPTLPSAPPGVPTVPSDTASELPAVLPPILPVAPGNGASK